MSRSVWRAAKVFFALALGLALLPGARAQTASLTPASYLLGTDDVLSIQVINFPELCVPQVTVPPDGAITVPLLGRLPVMGKTTEQVARTLTTRWTEYVNDPSVTVTLTQKRRQSIQFYGHVVHPQAVDYRPNLHLMAALAQVGGVADDGDRERVTVTHSDGSKQSVDLTDPETAAGTERDLLLAPDDVVYVPERHVQVSVLGEVVKPGSYTYTDKMTVLDALKDADNIVPDTADLSHATLQRSGAESPLDLDALLHQGQTEANVALMPGDRIFIPTLHNRIYVEGAVGHPGPYLLKLGDRLVDAISGAGGLLPGSSDMAKVNVIHQNKRTNTAQGQTVNIGNFYQKNDMSANIALAPGDVVFVPLKGRHYNVGDVIGTLSGVGALAGNVKYLGGL